jgi:hypothetical protein
MRRGHQLQSPTARSVVRRIAALDLDLRGLHVLTEAATGPYSATPVIAAAAGATVTAVAKASHHGSVADAIGHVMQLASELRVAGQIRITESLSASDIGSADIATNSGHLRPLDAAFISQMKPGAAIPLMYESWEFRPDDIDLEACRARGIRIAGTNECHAELRIFEFLGLLAVRGLFHCEIPVCLSRILLISDNPFAPHIANTLIQCGAQLEVFADAPIPASTPAIRRAADRPGAYDAVVVAASPREEPIIGRAGVARHAVDRIGEFGALVQLWGDVDRSCLPDVLCYPTIAPRKGHMGVLLSELGPDPVVRLQAGGLKVGEVLVKQPDGADPAWDYCRKIGAAS